VKVTFSRGETSLLYTKRVYSLTKTVAIIFSAFYIRQDTVGDISSCLSPFKRIITVLRGEADYSLSVGMLKLP